MASWEPIENPSDGISGGLKGQNQLAKSLFVAFFAVAWYNVIELIILVFATFRRYKGVYFWSLLIASVGIVPYSVGLTLKLFQLTHLNPLSVLILVIGWWAMVTGQALVLWSRLHLVLQNPNTLRRVLWMIIIDAIILHIPTTVLVFGANCGSEAAKFIHAYSIMEKIQLTGFCIQEFILSGLYIWEALQLLKFTSRAKDRGLMRQLLAMNLIIILMDGVLLMTQYTNLYAFQVTLKAMVYSIKLKLEYAVLSKLVDFVKGVGRGRLGGVPYEDTAAVVDFNDLSFTSSNISSLSAIAQPKGSKIVPK